ncbi:MAG TPA: sigma-54 dependent transcriptional regulator [Thermoanaerobaculia bacterium]|nr:sigma-54 dependent transcriptional regulator [Thermoanaerobaculia bacterium]
MDTILLVEDKESLARMIREALEPEGFAVDWAPSGGEALRRIAAGRRYGLVLTDLRLPGADGIEVLRAVREHDSDCPVIVMTAYGTIEDAVEAMKIGAWDFVQKPLDVDYLLLLVRRGSEHRALRSENMLLREEFQKRLGLPIIIGDSPPMKDVTRQIQKVAPTDSSVLLLGESGTGKELFARAIHGLSPRKDRPFVAINCAAIPDTLIENELFGHEKGAYTGAGSRQIGKFELAHGGTVFLDEIGELSQGVQSKVLRALQERTIERVGGTQTIEVDIRVICATNRDLRAAVEQGEFREDLYFRIHVFPVTIPPLRARREDIEPLVRYFVSKFAADMGKKKMDVDEEARDILRGYDWPGNIRELENAIERAVILADGGTIRARDLQLFAAAGGGERLRESFDLSGTLDQAGERARELVERAKISEVLRGAPDRQHAAERLGLTPRALAAKLRLYGIEEAES